MEDENNVSNQLIWEIVRWQETLDIDMPAVDPYHPTAEESVLLAQQICDKIDRLGRLFRNQEIALEFSAAIPDTSDEMTIKIWALLIALADSRQALGTRMQEVFDLKAPGRIDAIKVELGKRFESLPGFKESGISFCQLDDALALMFWLILYQWVPPTQ